MLFSDNIVLIDESREGLNTKLEPWRDTLEAKGFRLNRSKAKYLPCRFSAHGGVIDEAAIGSVVIPRVERFKYLGSII